MGSHKKNWGATFNYLTAHVAKLSQLHPKSSTHALKASWKLLGSCPNHKPFCCFQPLGTNTNPNLSELRSENKEMRHGGAERRAAATVTVTSLPMNSPLLPSPAHDPHERPTEVGFYTRRRGGDGRWGGVCVCKDSLAGYGGLPPTLCPQP